MKIPSPQFDLPRNLSGGSDAWDEVQGGVVLSNDFFDDAPPVTGWLSGWSNRVKVTIAASQVTADLTDFPVYVDLATLPAGFHSIVKTDGGDIRVTTADGLTQVPREVVVYNAATDTGEMHFKGPLVSDTVNTDFYIYFGNAAANEPTVSATFGAQNVWTNAYLAVYHMQQDPSGNGTDAVKDSTANAHHLTPAGAPILATGKLSGRAIAFDGVNDQLVDADQAWLNSYDQVTVSMWSNFASADGAQNATIYRYTSAEPQRNSAHCPWANEFYFDFGDVGGPGRVAGSYLPYDDKYTLIHFTSNGSTRKRIYGDGALAYSNDVTAANPNVTLTGLTIGSGGGVEWHKGIVDEFRAATVERTAQWIAAENVNQATPGTFYGVGIVETASGSTTVNNNRNSELSGSISMNVIRSAEMSGGNGAGNLGSDTNDGGTQTRALDRLYLSRFIASENGFAKTGSAYLSHLTGAAAISKFKIAIYSDVSGVPTALLAVSQEGNLIGTTEALYTLNFLTGNQIKLVSGTAYWIGISIELSDTGDSHAISRLNDASLGYIWDQEYTGGPAPTLPTADFILNGPYNTFVTYATTGAANDIRSSELSGSAASNALRSAELSGQASSIDVRSAELFGSILSTDQRPAEINASAPSNSIQSAEIQGQDTASSNRPSEMTGVLGAADNRPAEITGIATDNNIRSAEISGSQSAAVNRSSELQGAAGSNSVRFAEMHGQDTSTNIRPAELAGKIDSSSNRPAELSGAASSAAIRSAEMEGEVAAGTAINSNRPAEITGVDTGSNIRSAEMSGAVRATSDRLSEIRSEAAIASNRSAEMTGGFASSSTRLSEMNAAFRPQDIKGDFTIVSKSVDTNLVRDIENLSLTRSEDNSDVTHKGGSYGLTRKGDII